MRVSLPSHSLYLFPLLISCSFGCAKAADSIQLEQRNLAAPSPRSVADVPDGKSGESNDGLSSGGANDASVESLASAAGTAGAASTMPAAGGGSGGMLSTNTSTASAGATSAVADSGLVDSGVADAGAQKDSGGQVIAPKPRVCEGGVCPTCWREPPEGCAVCDIANQDERPGCMAYLLCFEQHHCGPGDPCAAIDAYCGINTIGAGALPLEKAQETYINCGCVDGT